MGKIDNMEGAEDEIQRLRTALEFYANHDNWSGCAEDGSSTIDNSPAGLDSGDIARAALKHTSTDARAIPDHPLTD